MVRCLFVVLWVCLVSTVGLAQSEKVLTLERALQLAQKNNLSLQQQEQMLRQALAVVNEHQAAYWPTFSLVSHASHISAVPQLNIEPFPGFSQQIQAGVKNQYEVALQVVQPLFTGFRLRSQLKTSEIKVQQSQINRQLLLNRIFLQIHRLYYAVQMNYFQQDIARASISRIRNHLRQVKNLLSAQQATAFDTLEVANRLLEVEIRLRKLQHQKKILLYQFARVLNLPRVDSLAVVSTEKRAVQFAPLEQYEELARRNRPEFILNHLKIQEFAFRKKTVRAQYFPQVYGQASYHYGRPGADFFKDEWMTYYQFGVQLQWELWNHGRRKHQLRQIDYLLKKQDLENQRLWQSVREEILTAYEGMQSALEQIQLHRRLVAQEEKRYRIASEKYEQGLINSTELRDAEIALTTVQSELKKDYVDFLLNEALMRYATGTIGKVAEE